MKVVSTPNPREVFTCIVSSALLSSVTQEVRNSHLTLGRLDLYFSGTILSGHDQSFIRG